MTFNPMLPVWLLVAFGLLLVGYVMFALVRAEGRARLMWVGRLVLVLALVGAIARPGVGSVAANVANDAVDVVFVVDTSPSIAAEDWDGGEMRLDAVKDDIAELAAAHPGARYALITFGRTAVQRLPFTNDATALQESVNQLAPDDAYYAMGSSPFAAADLLEEVLQGAADADTKGERARLVYYLGDGEDTGGDRPLDFSDSATLIQGGSVLGYGTEAGGRMRAYDEYGRDYGDYIYDTRTYEDGISVIDEGNLDDIAQQLRVRYQHRDANADLEPATVDVARGVMSSDAANRMTFPIYWAFAAVAVAWLLFEAFVLTRSGRQLRDAIEDQDARDDARRAAEEARNG